MSNEGKHVRSWQEIAAEASRERDPKKREELARELEHALDARDRKLTPQPIPTNRRQQSA
jgi:hypothetical protein